MVTSVGRIRGGFWICQRAPLVVHSLRLEPDIEKWITLWRMTWMVEIPFTYLDMKSKKSSSSSSKSDLLACWVNWLFTSVGICFPLRQIRQYLIRRKSTLTTWGLFLRLGLCFRIRGHLDHLGHKKNFSLGRGEVTCMFSIDIRLIALLSGLSTTFLEKPSKPASH